MVKKWLKYTKEYAHRIVPILAGIFLLAAGYFFIRYSVAKTVVVSHVGGQLHAIGAERKQQIIDALVEQKKQTRILANNPEFIAYFNSLLNVFDPTKDTQEYKTQEAKLDQFFNQYKSVFNYRDIFLIGADGTIFYTNKIDVDPANKNVLSPSLSSGVLGRSFDRARLTFTADVSEFGVSLIAKEPALYIVEPLLINNQFVGALAVWIDETILYKIIQNYLGLGRNGDIILTKNIGDRLLIVGPSRLYPNVTFQKITNPDKFALTPERKGSLGQEGQGLITNSFGINVVAAWFFVPELDCGLTITIPISEVDQPISFFQFWLKIFGGLLLLCLVALLIQFRNNRHIKKMRAYLFSQRSLRRMLWLIFISSLIASTFLIWHYYNGYRTIFNATKQLVQTKIHEQALLIEQNMTQVEKVAQMIAKDLQSEALKKEDISTRIDRDVKELPEVSSITVEYAPFAYDPKERLHGIQAQRIDNAVKTNVLTVDYMIPGFAKDPQLGWYDKAMKTGAFWSEPYFNEITKKQEVLYVLPFHQGNNTQPAGVIGIAYQLDKILAHVRSLEIGKTGYAVIIASNGSFIYHPLAHYVKEKIRLIDIAREQNNKELIDLAQQINKETTGFTSYYDQGSPLQHWIMYERVPSTGWTIAVFFSEESLDLPRTTMHHERMWILMSIVIALLFASMLLSQLERGEFSHFRDWSVFSAILFAVALIVFWGVMRRSSYQPPPNTVMVRDQANLDQYIESLNLDAKQRNEEKPIIIPTGINVFALAFPDSNKISVSGYAWQKIKKGTELNKGIRFPDASSVTLKEVLNKTTADQELIGWSFNAHLAQKNRYSWFPFDLVHVDILIASADFEKNIVLVPDFSSYQSVEIDPIPGVSTKISVPGFDLEHSFFSFTTIAPYDEEGLETLRKSTEKVQLHYNVILKRKLTHPFILFFLPLLIILFSIYAVFLVSFKRSSFDIFKSLSSYIAIFFSLVILHQTLRNQYQAGELLYIEYFFFFTYLTLLLLILHAIILRVTRWSTFVNEKISPYLKIFFWPVQFAVWFILTMIIFYPIR